LRKAIPQFPAEGLDWLGGLSEFYFQAPHTMSMAQQDAYLGYFGELLGREATKSTVEKMLALRMFSLLDAEHNDFEEAREDWETYLRLYQQVHPPNPRLAAIGYSWLGEQLAKHGPSSSFFGGSSSRMRDAAGARDCLKKAIQLNPNHIQPFLLLCKVYEELKQRSERNHLLDEMTRRFPEEKAVLLEAARRCVERTWIRAFPRKSWFAATCWPVSTTRRGKLKRAAESWNLSRN
jgi:tetratricopeptide (TPR) repeat protein